MTPGHTPTARGEPGGWHEVLTVLGVVLFLSGLLWWRALPLPDDDTHYFAEPAYLLAHTGHLAGPASQGMDLTLQRGYYLYPPGHYLVLAGWIKLFGFSNDSLLAFTHAVHALLVVALWVLLRKRYGCSTLASTLVAISVFAVIPHGRPDLTAALFGVMAWLALPDQEQAWSRARVAASGCCAGATLLCSPGLGVGLLATLAALMLITPARSLWSRCQSLVVWLTSAVGVFVSVVAIVLSTQHAWTLAFVQFTSHVTIRGRTDNLLPDLHTPYAIVFSVIPFLLLAVVPACVSIWHWRRRDTEWLVAVSFLAGAAVWLLVNKRDLLLARHFLFVSKSVFLGVYGTRLGRSAWLRIGALLVVATINLYAFKDEFLYLATPLRAEAQRSAAAIHPAGVLAVDSLYFVTFYRIGETLDYSSLLVTPMWPAYRAAIPDRFRAGLLAGLADAPAQPSMLIVSAMSVFRFGEPQLENFQCSGARQPISRLRVLGRTWNLPAHPYDVRLCTLR